MSDTAHFEYVAEDLISHSLQLAGLLVAKPKNDRLGTDLLVFNEVADGVKFCRIQCKGRSVLHSDAHVEIRTEYVTNGFVLFLFVESEPAKGNLYCFRPNDIRSWKTNNSGKFRLGIGRASHSETLAPWLFGPASIEAIKETIRAAEATNEFRNLIVGQLAVTLGPVTGCATGVIGGLSK